MPLVSEAYQIAQQLPFNERRCTAHDPLVQARSDKYAHPGSDLAYRGLQMCPIPKKSLVRVQYRPLVTRPILTPMHATPENVVPPHREPAIRRTCEAPRPTMHRLSTMLICLLAVRAAVGAELLVPSEHPTISAAIKTASDGDTIRVSAGTYVERLDLRGKSITIVGIDGAEATIVDGGGTGRSSTVTCDSDESSRTRLINLTFTGGKGQMNTNRGEIMGGGLLIRDASPVFVGCTFRDNNAQYGSGGGIAITGGSPLFLDCMITSNRADNIAGGLLIKDSDATFIRCGFVGNSAPCGGGAYIWHDARPSFESCTFIDNAALLSGGGIFNWNAAPVLSQCSFAGNRSAIGSAICNLSGAPSLINTRLDTDQQIKEAQPHPLHADEPPAPAAQ